MANKTEELNVDLIIKQVESDDVLKDMEENDQLGANEIILTKNDTEVPMMPVGSIFASAIPQTDARVHLLDGSTIAQTGVYETFANLIKTLVSAGNNISCTQSQFDSDVSLTGNCGKFVIDNTAGTIRLPKITTFIQGLSSITNIGSSLSAGLPNIEGSFYTRAGAGYNGAVANADGSFTYTLNSGTGDFSPIATSGSTGYPLSVTSFNANNGASTKNIYGNSSTVQPNSTQYPYYIVLASGYKSSQVTDIDNIMNDINGVYKSATFKFAETERLKTLNLFNKDGASASRSYGQWGLSVYDLVPTKALGSKITISFSESMREIRFTTTDENGPLVTRTAGSYITLPMDSDWWIDNRSSIFMYIQKTDGTWINKFADLITLDIMVTYGSTPQSYQPYYGDIVHQKEIYPVGAIYLSVDEISPAQIFGGIWEQISAGYALWTTTTANDGGNTIPAGLPNITGGTMNESVSMSVWNGNQKSYGALRLGTRLFDTAPSSGYGWFSNLAFDASKGETKTDGTVQNNVYGKSNTVQPPAYKVYAWERVG